MSLFRLLYRSDSALVGSDAAQRALASDIVAAGAKRNAAAGLTGALLFAGGHFVQALEGPAGALEATFERICCDLRHRRLVLMEFSESQERVFAPWSLVAVPAPRDPTLLGPAFERSATDAGSAIAMVDLLRALLAADPPGPGTGHPIAERPKPRAAAGAPC